MLKIRSIRNVQNNGGLKVWRYFVAGAQGDERFFRCGEAIMI